MPLPIAAITRLLDEGTAHFGRGATASGATAIVVAACLVVFGAPAARPRRSGGGPRARRRGDR